MYFLVISLVNSWSQEGVNVYSQSVAVIIDFSKISWIIEVVDFIVIAVESTVPRPGLTVTARVKSLKVSKKSIDWNVFLDSSCACCHQ